LRRFLRKTPELAATGGRSFVVEEHAVGVTAPPTAERNRNHLPASSQFCGTTIRMRHAA
jgi:hypothetical protein